MLSLRLFVIGTLTCVLACAFTARAENADVPLLSLKDAVHTAQSVSPDIKALEAQTLSAQAKVHQAFAPYEPQLTIGFMDSPHLLDIGNPASRQVSVQEQIGFPGRAAINYTALSNQAKSLESQLHATELQVASNVKNAYFQLALARENLRLNQETRDGYLRIEQIARRRYAVGAIPQVDLLNAQVTLYGNDSDLSDLQSAERSSLAQLNVLLQRPLAQNVAVEPFHTTYFPLPSLEDAENRMLDSRNEIRAARFTAQAADNAVTLAKYSLLPDFFVTLGANDYAYYGASPWSTMNSNYPTYTYTASLQVSIPLFGFFNEREAIKGATQDHANAEALLQSQLNQSRTTLTATLETLKALASRLKNNEDHLLPLSDQAFNLALINYSAGKIDFETLSNAAASRRNVRQAYLQAIVNYLNNYATLGQLLGQDL